LLFSCKSESSYKYGEEIVYDKFRGDKSSIINLTQNESLKKCFSNFDFSIYKDKKVKYKINSANDLVYDQVKNLFNIAEINNNIKIVEEKKDNNGNEKNKVPEEKADYKITMNVICGGYYIYDGFIFKNYKSVTRIVLLSTDTKTEKTKYIDSNYQEYKYFTIEFTDYFITFIYLWVTILLLLIIYLKIIRKKSN